MMITTGIIIAN